MNLENRKETTNNITEVIKIHTDLITKRRKLLLSNLKDIMLNNDIELENSFVYKIMWDKEQKEFNICIVDHLYKTNKINYFTINHCFKIKNGSIKQITDSKIYVHESINVKKKRNIDTNKILNICTQELYCNFVEENIDDIIDMGRSIHYYTTLIPYIILDEDIHISCIDDFYENFRTIRFNDLNDLGMHIDMTYRNRIDGVEHIIIPLRTDEDLLPFCEMNKLFLTQDKLNILKEAQKAIKNYFYE